MCPKPPLLAVHCKDCNLLPLPQKGMRGKTNKCVHMHVGGGAVGHKGEPEWRVMQPRYGRWWWHLAQPLCMPGPVPSPSSLLSPTNPALRVNSYPKVTVSKKH
jgi:hypothetical protein